ncbi:MAG: prepilin peptidase [Planctomycetota bacterium]|jgi:leader peptidase (prepilin peptidase)/N-methyltransferase
MPPILYHLPTAVFVFCFGACVGSFLNVVIYRLPAGMSVITPPSRCPTCGARLSFFRDNLPVLGWFVLRGKCRRCRVRISPQYMIVELIMALTFVGLYAAFFLWSPTTGWWATPGTGWWSAIGGPWWYFNGLWRVWPAFTALAFLVAGLVAMTVIDARTFTIPIQIPLFVTVTAFVAWPLQAVLPITWTPSETWPVQGVGWGTLAASVGGMIGVVIGCVLLKTGRLRYSFADYDEYVREGEVLGDYPHARREMKPELLFLAPCIAGMVIGGLLGRVLPAGAPPAAVQALGASFTGYLVGGGLIWGVRILGTLGFGREAMGLGDVHLLAAVGAVLGWFDPIPIFFIAPFSGLLWALLSMGLGTVLRAVRRELPYGPHLAVATLIVILARPVVVQGWNAVLGRAIPWPVPGLVTSPPPPPAPVPAGGAGGGGGPPITVPGP